MGKDYHKILELRKDASEDDIKKAYRKMALLYHPDKNKTHDAGVRFQEIAEAYTVLSDSREKDSVDKYGDEVAFRGRMRQNRRNSGKRFNHKAHLSLLILLISLEHILEVLIHLGILFMTCYLTICTTNMHKLNHQIAHLPPYIQEMVERST